MVFGRYHRVRARAVGHPQAGSKVVRVGHAVQHQQQRILYTGRLQVFKQLVKRRDLRQRINPRHHALMAVAAAHFGQAQAVRFHQLDAAVTRAVGELAHARIAPLHVVEDFKHGLGRGFDAHAYSVKAEKIFGGGSHAVIIPIRGSGAICYFSLFLSAEETKPAFFYSPNPSV